MKPGGVLAIDCATITGWAYGARDDQVPACGTWKLAGAKRLGRSCVGLETELTDAVELYRPALVIQERAIVKADWAARFLLGLSAIVEATCCRLDMPLFSATSNDVRDLVMGQGRYPAGEAKEHVVAHCRMRGWDPEDHNAADACLTWRYGILECLPKLAA